MIWNDTYLKQRADFPKWFYYISFSTNSILAWCAIYSFLEKTKWIDKIIPAVGSLFLIYFGLYCVLMILKGNEYVESIEKEGDCFTLTDIFKKEINFTASDVLSVKTSKFSIITKYLTGFAKYVPGLELILKDGVKYYISPNMENINTLKEHLLEKKNILLQKGNK
ncbi:hypothetical protein Lnau_2308 [Legionella nautarum]|uniref:Transmembrane protein n=1 Tax=Legionella nautarum TaxID=45070 RepID=A0A0W0WMI0_9GAMM|nr:hypothetical protein [Legionella nautarum]KTD33557.1 hypothetical protein Lnau_2308 [Legionella nautarum]